jgi:hypothetical protein
MRHPYFIGLAAALLLGAASPARAQNEISLRVSDGFYPSSGLDLVSENDHLLGMELAYARELWELWRGSLWAEASYRISPSHARSFDRELESRALFQTITVGVLYRLPIWRWLVPHARFGLGVLVGSLGLTPSGGNEILDRSAALAGHLLAGAEFLWPRRRRGGLNFGLVVEGGYVFSSPLGFTNTPSPPDDLIAIPVRGADLGSFVLHGAEVRAGVVFRF